jgi:hypothetical protein
LTADDMRKAAFVAVERAHRGEPANPALILAGLVDRLAPLDYAIDWQFVADLAAWCDQELPEQKES